MAMVFCRGCAAEIHETATTCPKCGATQGIFRAPETQAGTPAKRNPFTLVVLAFGWTLIFWFMTLFVIGAIVGAINPDNAHDAGAAVGAFLSLPVLCVAAIVAGVLIHLGLLPGSKK